MDPVTHRLKTPTSTLLLGDVGHNKTLHRLHMGVSSQLTEAGVYDPYFDLVQFPDILLQEDPDINEIVASEAIISPVKQVILFDRGLECLLDIGIKLAPYVLNGAKCIVATTRSGGTYDDVAHELVSIVNIET